MERRIIRRINELVKQAAVDFSAEGVMVDFCRPRSELDVSSA
jgi:hypothetical protein